MNRLAVPPASPHARTRRGQATFELLLMFAFLLSLILLLSTFASLSYPKILDALQTSERRASAATLSLNLGTKYAVSGAEVSVLQYNDSPVLFHAEGHTVAIGPAILPMSSDGYGTSYTRLQNTPQ